MVYGIQFSNTNIVVGVKVKVSVCGGGVGVGTGRERENAITSRSACYRELWDIIIHAACM